MCWAERGGTLCGPILIDDEVLDRLGDGRLLPLVDSSSIDEHNVGAQSRGHPMARLLLSTNVPAAIAFRHPKVLHAALAAADPAWQLKDGYPARPLSGAKLVLSAGEISETTSSEDAWLRVEERQ